MHSVPPPFDRRGERGLVNRDQLCHGPTTWHATTATGLHACTLRHAEYRLEHRTMITLYAFGPGFGLPDPSPFVTKVEVLLKMAGLAYRTDTTGFRQAPKGKLPYIDDDGEQVADSTFIRWHLENKYRIDFDKGLSAEQRAVAWAFEKMAEDHLYWALVDARWFDEANFAKGPKNFLRTI